MSVELEHGISLVTCWRIRHFADTWTDFYYENL